MNTTLWTVRPSILANPFEGRPRISQARAAILYRHWLAGDLTPYVLRCAGFSYDEIEALERWRKRLTANLPRLRNRALRCRCGRSAPWCHLPTLKRAIRGMM